MGGLLELKFAAMKPNENPARIKLMERVTSRTTSLAAIDGATQGEQLKGSRLILKLKEMLLFLGC